MKLNIVFNVSFFLFFAVVFFPIHTHAQEKGLDTFFLARKKGIIGKLGRSISGYDIPDIPVKTVNPFLRFSGKKIQSISIVRLGFDQNLNDTVTSKSKFFVRLADHLHTNSRESLIKRNLFFKEGDTLIPLMLSDNERFLREQEFLRDAMIVVQTNGDPELVDIIVITRDVFSFGGKLSVRSSDRVRAEIDDENFQGTGGRIAVKSLYDGERNPRVGYGAEYLQRNIFRRFMNARVGFTTFDPALLTGFASETSVYFELDKPLVNRYNKFTGALNISYNKTRNNYLSDSLYNSDFKYKDVQFDVWGGINIGHVKRPFLNILKTYSSFITMRSFYLNYNQVPDIFTNVYNYNFANINGFLVSFNLFKQNFYKTNFIYGFGRNEDLPYGISTSLTGGWTNKDGKRRGYVALNMEGNFLTKRGKYYSYGIRGGGFTYQQNFEDIEMQVSIDHFSKLKKLNGNWRKRHFLSVYYASQFHNRLNNPLFLRTPFGLPYFTNPLIEGRARTTLKGETVFYNMKKFLGFRFAPFFFSDMSFLTPRNKSVLKTSGFFALGTGFRTRNENLVFGTIEVKGYYFPRTVGQMNNWRVDFATNVRFKYNSTFIRKPDFVSLN